MFHNITMDVMHSNKTVGPTGDARETVTTLAAAVRCVIQGHTIQSLPPPGQSHNMAGIMYVREYRCWIAKREMAQEIHTNDYLIITATRGRSAPVTVGHKLRVLAAIDDAGVGHHWLLRLVDYD